MLSDGYNKGTPTKIIFPSEFPLEFNDWRSVIQISNRNEVYFCGAEKNKKKNK